MQTTGRKALGQAPGGLGPRDLVRLVMQSTLDERIAARLDALDRSNLNEFGVDPFGFCPDEAKLYVGPAHWLYKYYFRVEQRGVDNIPDGRVLLVANHGGQLPMDGAMIIMSILAERTVPRLTRAMVEHWAAELPFVSTWFARCGQVIGDPDSCRRLLQANESVLVFPEGVKGISKTWGEIYQLRDFGLGFMRLALETRTPIVPVAVVGHEEQSLSIANLKGLGRILGMPSLPLTLTGLPFPLPSHYHLEFGQPLHFDGDANDDDDVVAEKVAQVKSTLQAMINSGLKRRGKRIFR